MDQPVSYTDQDIKTLPWQEHIRKRPGMYVGKLGDGSQPDDGIYTLFKEVMDNSMDEFLMGFGKKIIVTASDKDITVQDFGRGIPLGKLADCVASINTGGKYSAGAFVKSAGLNGVGIKATNALSSKFIVTSSREGTSLSLTYSEGKRRNKQECPSDITGTTVYFKPDATLFLGPDRQEYAFDFSILEDMIRQYVAINKGLTIVFNEREFSSQEGILDLLTARIARSSLRTTYEPIRLNAPDVEFIVTHTSQSDEILLSYVNGQNTIQGGTHVTAVRDIFFKAVRTFFATDFDTNDIRAGIALIVAIRIQDPVFESQTKTKLGSNALQDGKSLKVWLTESLATQLDNYLHRNPEVATKLKERILLSKKLREEISGLKKLAKEATKKSSINNPKLRDCAVHWNTNHKNKAETTLFITEGDSAAGSITQSRNAQTQAVFALKGKPLNTFGDSRKVVYQNEEFALLHNALGLEEGISNLRYNHIVFATDADVDGMHIRLLLTTYFLQFFPEVMAAGHIKILETPLFRVRNNKGTHYCYSDIEKDKLVTKLGGSPEITRFKGLGEISPSEFGQFIDKHIRLTPLNIGDIAPSDHTALLSYFMGKNTPERQEHIINNLSTDV